MVTKRNHSHVTILLTASHPQMLYKLSVVCESLLQHSAASANRIFLWDENDAVEEGQFNIGLTRNISCVWALCWPSPWGEFDFY